MVGRYHHRLQVVEGMVETNLLSLVGGGSLLLTSLLLALPLLEKSLRDENLVLCRDRSVSHRVSMVR